LINYELNRDHSFTEMPVPIASKLTSQITDPNEIFC
jgi:hypothetical protein